MELGMEVKIINYYRGSNIRRWHDARQAKAPSMEAQAVGAGLSSSFNNPAPALC